ncbi:hypothetical protein SAMN05421753_105225 [Planctomicrobium piriforme]|uniref:Uncharacterized protein n=1 Tax=Planctomicrobium piriforme TaxID=1576369 RepID=A0A1I3FFY1_9PLAN|nr:hypothetical protein SAMN05421753_105225 [Planctomicrobium piriforme]
MKSYQSTIEPKSALQSQAAGRYWFWYSFTFPGFRAR